MDIGTPGVLYDAGRASDDQIISASSGYTGVSFVCHPGLTKQSVIGLQYTVMTPGQSWATMDYGVHCNWGPADWAAVLEYTLQPSGAWSNDVTLMDRDSSNNPILTPNEVWQVRLKNATTVEYLVGNRVVHTSTKPVTGDLHVVAHSWQGGTRATDVKYVQQSLTGGGTATAFGDPHVQNIMGTKFEIRRSGSHLMVAIPRGSEASVSLLRVTATVQPAAEECGGMYIKSVTIDGQWLGDVPSMTFSAPLTVVPGGALFGNELQVGDGVGLTPEEFSARVPRSMVALVLPSKPPALPDEANRHASIMMAHMKFGPGVVTKLSWVAERTPTAGVINSIWISVTQLAKANTSVGGLMGMDDFLSVSKPGPECERDGKRMQWRLDKSARVVAGADKAGQEWLAAGAF